MPYEDYDMTRLMFDQLGEGTYGAIFKIRRKSDDKNFALKLVDQRFAEMQNLIQEAHLQKQSKHENIANIEEYFVQEERLYIIMSLYEGDLSQLIEKYKSQNKQFSDDYILKIYLQLIQALNYLHKLQILHRDVKPQNMLLDEDLNIYLSDFGIARANEQDSGKTTNIGTQDYMSPELFESTSDYDYQPDIWASGVVLYQLMTLSLPFQSHKHQISCQFIVPKVNNQESQQHLAQLFPLIFREYKSRITSAQIIDYLNSDQDINQFQFKDLYSQKIYTQLSNKYKCVIVDKVIRRMLNLLQISDKNLITNIEQGLQVENDEVQQLGIQEGVTFNDEEIHQIRRIAICLLDI
ncbi:Kinase, NEK [Spironucleus salmonicida]|uniref:non-specific serine/threonine protein kinase n=1 Tax=Spironucleus salmonicida TaxID=348837 RepID=V6LWB1_9EUKA|nr:Kinase, NEK [Spironucleus salmonicida]|eukprot:EST45099.1 Kinase, NEK [Spironucleus salmonicida]